MSLLIGLSWCFGPCWILETWLYLVMTILISCSHVSECGCCLLSSVLYYISALKKYIIYTHKYMHIRLQAMLLNLKSFRLFRATCSTPALFRFSCAPWTNFFTPKSVRGSPPSSPPHIHSDTNTNTDTHTQRSLT